MYLRMLLLKKHYNNGKMFLEFLSNLTLQTCCKQSCVEIEICVLFTYIRRLLHKGLGPVNGTDAERMRNGTERIWRNGTERNGYGVKMRNGTERIWG